VPGAVFGFFVGLSPSGELAVSWAFCRFLSLLPSLSPFHQWGPIFYTAGDKIGRTFEMVKQAPGLLKEVGFQEVQEKRMKLLLGSWPTDKKLKNVGVFNLVETEVGLEGFALYVLTQVHGWEAGEAGIYIDRVRKELRNQGKHPYYAL